MPGRIFFHKPLLILCCSCLYFQWCKAQNITDFHTHLQDSSLIKCLSQLNAIWGEGAPAKDSVVLNADSLIIEMDQAHIDNAVILSCAYMFGAPGLYMEDEYQRVKNENDWIAQQASLYPQRLKAYCSVNPLKNYAVNEIKRCAAGKKFAGLKLHFTNGEINLRKNEHVKKLQVIFAVADSLRMPVTVHMRTLKNDYGANDAAIFIDKILSKTKHIPVQIAHMSGWGGYDESTDVALQVFIDAFNKGIISRKNIYFDISAVVPAINEPWGLDVGDIKTSQKKSWDAKAALIKKIGQIGINNILFGSDYPVISLKDYIKNLEISLGVQTTQHLLKNKLPGVYQ